MTATDAEPGRVLIMRVWFEPGPRSEGFRARITTTLDIESGEQESTVVSSPSAAVDLVRGWLAQSCP